MTEQAAHRLAEKMAFGFWECIGGEKKMELLELVKLTEEGENIVLEVLDKEKGTTEKQKVTPKVLASYEACVVCGLWVETDEEGEPALTVKVEK